MRKTLLTSAGALALSIAFASGVMATENDANADGDQIAVQDILNGSLNGNGSGNTFRSGNDNDELDLDVVDSGNGSLNGNGSGNVVRSANDNDGLDLDADVKDSFNDGSSDDNDLVDVDATLKDIGNDKSKTSFSWSHRETDDHSIAIDDVALLVSSQYLDGWAAPTNMGAAHGNVATGSVEFGEGANSLAAGNMTDSINTGAGSVALATSAIQANGSFTLGR